MPERRGPDQGRPRRSGPARLKGGAAVADNRRARTDDRSASTRRPGRPADLIAHLIRAATPSVQGLNAKMVKVGHCPARSARTDLSRDEGTDAQRAGQVT